ncbi:MAG: helix-turn-helix transcriptional regulator [Hyphomicrobiales bacterium]|nr:helix-turn-helix transcriptional regulator [Hyphomicrobiales bacterium]
MARSVRSASKGDQEVGAKIRARRRALAVSQSDLGDKIGVSYRQVQKYEAGVNRISIMRLEQIAAALDGRLSDFLDSAPDESTSALDAFAVLPEAQVFLDAYLSIADPATRKLIVTLTLSLAGQANQPAGDCE